MLCSVSADDTNQIKDGVLHKSVMEDWDRGTVSLVEEYTQRRDRQQGRMHIPKSHPKNAETTCHAIRLKRICVQSLIHPPSRCVLVCRVDADIGHAFWIGPSFTCSATGQMSELCTTSRGPSTTARLMRVMKSLLA